MSSIYQDEQTNRESISQSVHVALLIVSALTVYVAIFAARFSFSQSYPNNFSELLIMGEVRTWAILAGLMLAALGWRFYKPTLDLANKLQVWRGLGLVAILQAAIIIHTLFYNFGEESAYFVWELLAIVLVALLLGFYYCIWGLQFVGVLMWVSLAFGMLFAVCVWGGVINFKNPISENTIGTTFTFYRIMIFGAYAALVIYFRWGGKNGVKWALLLCSALCFAGAFITLSKAALLAGSVGLLLLTAIFLIWFEKIKALIVSLVFVGAIGLFVMVSASGFAARVGEGLFGIGYQLNVRSVSLMPAEEVWLTSDLTVKRGPCLVVRSNDCMLELVRAEFEAQRRLAEVLACTAGGYPCEFPVERWEQEIVDTMLQFRVYIPDFSFRIRLVMHGLTGLTKAPWIGNGFGHFHVVGVNLYTKNFDHYFYPHNILIELLYAVGILGALFVGAVLFVLIWEVLRFKDKVQPCLPLFAFVVAMGVGSLFGGDYVDFRLVWFGLLLCIMLCENTAPVKLPLPEVVK